MLLTIFNVSRDGVDKAAQINTAVECAIGDNMLKPLGRAISKPTRDAESVEKVALEVWVLLNFSGASICAFYFHIRGQCGT